MSLTGGAIGPQMVTQVGSTEQCTRPGCTSVPMLRVIFGGMILQAYTCTKHIGWVLRFDLLSHDTQTRNGWRQRYGTIHPTQVTHTMPAITRADYGRTETVSAAYPVMREGTPTYR